MTWSRSLKLAKEIDARPKVDAEMPLASQRVKRGRQTVKRV